MTDHGPLDHRFAGLQQIFVIAHQSSKLDQPGKSSFHDPALRMDNKTDLAGRFFDDLKHPIRHIGDEFDQKSTVDIVGIEMQQAVTIGFQLRQDRQRPVSILGAGGGHFQTPDQTQRVYREMALAPFDLLIGVEADARLLFRPPFEVVFTDWLSRMATEGVGALPI